MAWSPHAVTSLQVFHVSQRVASVQGADSAEVGFLNRVILSALAARCRKGTQQVRV